MALRDQLLKDSTFQTTSFVSTLFCGSTALNDMLSKSWGPQRSITEGFISVPVQERPFQSTFYDVFFRPLLVLQPSSVGIQREFPAIVKGCELLLKNCFGDLNYCETAPGRTTPIRFAGS